MSGGGKSTVMGAAINLSKLCLGAGIMALPRATSHGGLLFAPLCLAVLAAWNDVSSVMLVNCHEQTKFQKDFPVGLSSIFARIAYAAAGWFGVFVTDLCITATLIGVTISYQMLFASLLSDVPWVAYAVSKEALTYVFALIVYPLSMAKDVGSLAKYSFLGLVCLSFSLLAILGYGMMTYSLFPTATVAEASPVPPLVQYWPQSIEDFTAYIGVATFGFGVTTVQFPVYESMEDPVRDFNKAVLWAMIFTTVIYIIVGNVLSSLFIQDPSMGIADNIMTNLPAESVAATMVRVAMAATAVLSFPLAIVPAAQIMEKFIFVKLTGCMSRAIGGGAAAAAETGVDAEEDRPTELEPFGAVEFTRRRSSSLDVSIASRLVAGSPQIDISRLKSASIDHGIVIERLGNNSRRNSLSAGSPVVMYQSLSSRDNRVSSFTSGIESGGGAAAVSDGDDEIIHALIQTLEEDKDQVSFSKTVCHRTLLLAFTTYVSINLTCFSMVSAVLCLMPLSLLLNVCLLSSTYTGIAIACPLGINTMYIFHRIERRFD